MRLVVWLGAGFGVPAGLPIGAHLFDRVVLPHSKRAASDAEATLSAWEAWHRSHPDAAPEEFMTSIYERRSRETIALWPSIVRFLGYRLAGTFATFYQYEGRTSRARDNIFEARLCPVHTQWWNTIFSRTPSKALTVITTNWDICIERALRPGPTKRPRRPGFHYGWGPERLQATTAHPRSHWRRAPFIGGVVPVLKLHGSLNWAVENSRLVKYGDLRPAFRGDAAVVPPVRYKEPPSWAEELWALARTALAGASRLLVVGYSFPPYDEQVGRLFDEGLSCSSAPVHVFDPNAKKICARISALTARPRISGHPGLPEGLVDLSGLLS